MSFDTTKNLKGWQIGGQIGFYFADKYHANFYNGSEKNENTLNYILSNKYWYQEIRNSLDVKTNRDSFRVAEIPQQMYYDKPMYLGFSARYNFSSQLALNFAFNFAKLQTRNQVVVELIPPLEGQVQSFEYFGLLGVERRTNIDVSLIYASESTNNLSLIGEIGLNVNNTLVEKHSLFVFDKEYNMVNIYLNNSYVPNTQINEYEVRQGGIGGGAFTSLGLRYSLTRYSCIEMVFMTYVKSINLENYNKLGFHFAPMIRLAFSPVMKK